MWDNQSMNRGRNYTWKNLTKSFPSAPHQPPALTILAFLVIPPFVFFEMLYIFLHKTNEYIIGQRVQSHEQEGDWESPTLKRPKGKACAYVQQEEGTQHHNERQSLTFTCNNNRLHLHLMLLLWHIFSNQGQWQVGILHSSSLNNIHNLLVWHLHLVYVAWDCHHHHPIQYYLFLFV